MIIRPPSCDCRCVGDLSSSVPPSASSAPSSASSSVSASASASSSGSSSSSSASSTSISTAGYDCSANFDQWPASSAYCVSGLGAITGGYSLECGTTYDFTDELTPCMRFIHGFYGVPPVLDCWWSSCGNAASPAEKHQIVLRYRPGLSRWELELYGYTVATGSNCYMTMYICADANFNPLGASTFTGPTGAAGACYYCYSGYPATLTVSACAPCDAC